MKIEYSGAAAMAALLICGMAAPRGSVPKAQELTSAQASTTKPMLTRPETRDDRLAFACRPGEDIRWSDLCAQWKAADAADRSAYWTMVQAVLSLLGIGGLIYNLLLTRAAVKSAEEAGTYSIAAVEAGNRSAEAAVRSVELAELNSKRELRPYLSASDPIVSAHGPDFTAVALTITNDGKTPAFIRSVKRAVFPHRFPVLLADVDLSVLKPFFNFQTLLVPGGKLRISTSITGEPDSLDEALADTMNTSLFTFCEVEFADVFGDKHVHQSSFRSGGVWFGTGTDFVACSFFNRQASLKNPA
ncbi:hypothetical protein [Sphingomonas jatrophae]|uniref:Uncharacterized protein n=1 Tax=Sphingomonas jatrophae TaxID=1166337 RepID=A0A1I6K5K2_9SPHN|nr:hypothetical protein [Sphingomonas jatrophae]SFR86509.1 hypothetical protein SAMN05192580_1352 [Sphingomonas jatrophae]